MADSSTTSSSSSSSSNNNTNNNAPSAGRPQVSRSTSVTKSTRTTHQRKPSLNIPSNLYPIPEKVTLNNTNANIMPPPPLPSSSSVVPPPSSPKRLRSSSSSFSWRTLLHRIDFFLKPSGPLLPQDKHGAAFGGTGKKSRISQIVRSRSVRFLFLFYVVFSVFLSINHLWHWMFGADTVQLDARFGDQWKPQRPYDQDEPYSIMDDMTHGLKMSKLFSKSFYDAAGSTQPFWLKASKPAQENDITLVTTVTPGSWSELVRLAEQWQGPVSVTLHTRSLVDGGVSTLNQIREAYANKPELAERVDVHLVRSPGKEVLSVLLPRNAERNMARMFAHTRYVCEMSSHMVPATDVRRTLDANREYFETLLNSGDMLVVPTFGFPAPHEDAKYTIPYKKSRLLELVEAGQMGLVDPHWDMNEGPTDLHRWQDATTLYAVENYDFHYEPIVVESKAVQPWCAERFLDRRSACLFSNYLAGGEFWVLPDDFAVQLPDNKEFVISDFDLVLENRLYAKFFWEQCVHHARQLDALGLWKSARSEHVRKQCSRVIQNWGKGLIGKPE